MSENDRFLFSQSHMSLGRGEFGVIQLLKINSEGNLLKKLSHHKIV